MNFEKKIQNYFREFSERFFDNKLHNVKLEFSGRMKNSAGIFYPSGKQGSSCKIRLNRPMLLLRSDKEAMETLLVRRNMFFRLN